MDWVKAVAGIKWSYLMELRDTGKHGFLLPIEQILPNADEMYSGLQAFTLNIKDQK